MTLREKVRIPIMQKTIKGQQNSQILQRAKYLWHQRMNKLGP